MSVIMDFTFLGRIIYIHNSLVNGRKPTSLSSFRPNDYLDSNRGQLFSSQSLLHC